MEEASWKSIEESFETIKEELGNPPIKLLTPEEFKNATGFSLLHNPQYGRPRHDLGRASFPHRAITVNQWRPSHAIKNVLYHETAHILFRSKPEWWIECFAAKMAGAQTGGERYDLYGHTPEDIPDKARLISLAKRASRRLKELKWQ